MIKPIECSHIFIDILMINDSFVEIIPRWIVKQGWISEITKTCEERVKIERDRGVDIVETHDIL